VREKEVPENSSTPTHKNSETKVRNETLGDFTTTREYAVDPLEILFVREVMRTTIAVLPAASTIAQIQPSLNSDHRQTQRLLPVVNADGTLAGVLTRKDIRDCINQDGNAALQRTLSEVARTNTSNVYSDEPLRVVVYRMAETGFTRMPVVDCASEKFLGLISLDDLLKARARHLEEERRRERTLKLRFFLPGGRLAEEKDISANP
jgi:chloride channel protein, CIC family